MHPAQRRLQKRLREHRARMRLSQEQASALAGLSEKHYQHLESGANPNPKLETLTRLAKGLGTDLCDLLGCDLRRPKKRGAFADDSEGKGTGGQEPEPVPGN